MLSGAQMTALFMLGLVSVGVIFISGFIAGQWWESKAKPVSQDVIDEFGKYGP